PVAFGALVQQVSVSRDFDAFVLGYGRLSLDPDYLRRFFHSADDKPRGNNRSGYRSEAFDRIADQSSKTMDIKKRQELICEMQRMIMQDVPWIPLYNPRLIEAVRADKFTGWVQMLEGIGNTWSFCTVKPK
ncbi:MAG: ABC transporter substrate-binding protein, partial [Pseudomonadota bacterium]